MNIVFFNVAWMKNYQGESESSGGGKWPTEQGWGHEIFNFKSPLFNSIFLSKL